MSQEIEVKLTGINNTNYKSILQVNNVKYNISL